MAPGPLPPSLWGSSRWRGRAALVPHLLARAEQRRLNEDLLGAEGGAGARRAVPGPPSFPGLGTVLLNAQICAPTLPGKTPVPTESQTGRSRSAARTGWHHSTRPSGDTATSLGVPRRHRLPRPSHSASPPTIATPAPKDGPIRSLGSKRRGQSPPPRLWNPRARPANAPEPQF